MNQNAQNRVAFACLGIAAALQSGCAAYSSQATDKLTCAMRPDCSRMMDDMRKPLESVHSLETWKQLRPMPMNAPDFRMSTYVYQYPQYGQDTDPLGRILEAGKTLTKAGYRCIASRTVPIVSNEAGNGIRLGFRAMHGDTMVLAACTRDCYGVSYQFSSTAGVNVTHVALKGGIPGALFKGEESNFRDYLSAPQLKNHGVNFFISGTGKKFAETQVEMHVFAMNGTGSCARQF